MSKINILAYVPRAAELKAMFLSRLSIQIPLSELVKWLVGLPDVQFLSSFPYTIITLLPYKIVAPPQAHHVVSLPTFHNFYQEKTLVNQAPVYKSPCNHPLGL